MAKIKTVKYEFEGTEYPIDFKCSTGGVFTCSMPFAIAQKMGVDPKTLETTTLPALEKVVTDAFIAYKNAKTSHCIKLWIDFKANGAYCKLPDGEWNPLLTGTHNPLHLSRMSGDIDAIGFSFKVLIEINIDGRITHYNAEKWNEDVHVPRGQYGIKYDNYSGWAKLSHHSAYSKATLIDYSEAAHKNLQDVQTQFQKASEFLSKLVTHENIQSILENNKVFAIPEQV